MANNLTRFKEFPPSVKYGIALLIIGWIFHYFFYFKIAASEFPIKTTYLQLGVGVFICYFVADIKPWARRLCMFFNVGIMGLYLLYGFVYFYAKNYYLCFFTIATALIFAVSAFYLFKKETAAFYIAMNQPAQDNDNILKKS